MKMTYYLRVYFHRYPFNEDIEESIELRVLALNEKTAIKKAKEYITQFGTWTEYEFLVKRI